MPTRTTGDREDRRPYSHPGLRRRDAALRGSDQALRRTQSDRHRVVPSWRAQRRAYSIQPQFAVSCPVVALRHFCSVSRGSFGCE